MHIPSRWAGNHDCELHYKLTELCAPRRRYNCGLCGGTIYMDDEAWTQLQVRAARKRQAIEAIPI